jgi:selenocysteine lyase/cysteine desulfurase
MLGARLRGQLGALPAVSVHDLGEVRCAIVTARVEGVPAAEVAGALGRAGVNVSTTVAGHSPLDTQDRAIHPLVRFSPHYYNTEAELDRAVSLVAAIARQGHTAGGLAPRG